MILLRLKRSRSRDCRLAVGVFVVFMPSWTFRFDTGQVVPSDGNFPFWALSLFPSQFLFSLFRSFLNFLTSISSCSAAQKLVLTLLCAFRVLLRAFRLASRICSVAPSLTNYATQTRKHSRAYHNERRIFASPLFAILLFPIFTANILVKLTSNTGIFFPVLYTLHTLASPC